MKEMHGNEKSKEVFWRYRRIGSTEERWVRYKRQLNMGMLQRRRIRPLDSIV